MNDENLNQAFDLSSVAAGNDDFRHHSQLGSHFQLVLRLFEKYSFPVNDTTWSVSFIIFIISSRDL